MIAVSIKNRFPPIWINFCLVFITLVTLSCSSSPHLSLFATETEWVDLREWPSGFLDVGPRTHPISVPPAKIQRILGSIYYRESSLFSFLLGKPKPVFSPYQVETLSKHISQALDQALPQEVVSFKIKKEEGDTHYAKGFCFVLDGDFHLVIQQLNKPDFYSSETNPRPNTIRSELVPQSGQRLFATRPDGKGVISNWIIIPLDHKGKTS